MNRGRREVVKSMGALAALAALGRVGAPAAAQGAGRHPAARRPNLLVFLSDDHSQWLQQAYGNSEVQTPNLNRLASSGVRMTNAYTPCPVCSPARASFFTGCMPSQHGIHDWIEERTHSYGYPWLQGQTLISEVLQAAGYHTGLVGKWHCGGERNPHPGFDYWFSYWVWQYPHLGEQHFSEQGREVVEEGFQSPLLTRRALEFLRRHYQDRATAQKPFFLFIGYTDTHVPHADMPQELVALYTRATFRDIPSEVFAPCHGRALVPVTADSGLERRKHEQYYASASSIDREVGKVLDELESRGELANTLVVYTSDHGLNAGQHGMWEKGNATLPQNFLEESIRIPCLISWPGGGIARNLQSDLWVNHCDLFATLLEAAGAVPSAETASRINSPGRSYLFHLRGQSGGPWRDYAICEYGNARMIRRQGYKLILRYPYKGKTFGNEFYDLAADSREAVDLYGRSQAPYARTVNDMRDQVEEFFAKFTSPGHSGLDLEDQPVATPASPWLA